jgi:glutaredoxin
LTNLIIYSRPGCHLCDEMKAVVRRVSASVPISLEEIDISGDTELERLYGLEIPVLLADGKKVAKYRIGEGELRRILKGLRAKG